MKTTRCILLILPLMLLAAFGQAQGGPSAPVAADSIHNNWPENNSRPWTLQECIAYAQVHNLQVQMQELNVRMSEINLRASKGQMLPNLNAGAAHTYQYGQTIDRFTNTFVNDRVLNQNFFVSSNVTLFNGLQNYNTVQQNKYNLEASRFGVDQTRYDISMNVASAYLNILFTEDQLTIAEKQRGLTKSQVDRTQKLVNAGAAARGTLLDLQTQLAQEEVAVVNATNNVTMAYLTLTQLMNLDSVAGFKIVRPDLNVPNESILSETPEQIFAAAQNIQPSIKQADASIKGAEKGVDVAQGALSPTLTLQGSLGTGYSGARQTATPVVNGVDTVGVTTGGDFVLVPGIDYNYAIVPFGEQLDNNFNQSFGVQLTIPIFNRLQVNSNVQRAEVQYQNAQLNSDLAKQNLLKNIQQAHADAKASLERYRAQQSALSAAEEAFKYTEEKFNVGSVNTIDYTNAKNRLAKAESDVLQAKFDYIFRLKVLEYYKGNPITF